MQCTFFSGWVRCGGKSFWYTVSDCHDRNDILWLDNCRYACLRYMLPTVSRCCGAEHGQETW